MNKESRNRPIKLRTSFLHKTIKSEKISEVRHDISNTLHL